MTSFRKQQRFDPVMPSENACSSGGLARPKAYISLPRIFDETATLAAVFISFVHCARASGSRGFGCDLYKA
jgi:hypothetical protein